MQEKHHYGFHSGKASRTTSWKYKVLPVFYVFSEISSEPGIVDFPLRWFVGIFSFEGGVGEGIYLDIHLKLHPH